MAVSDEDIAFATDLFADLGQITTRKMMGGLCLYHEGTIFAMLHPELGLMIKGAGEFQKQLDAMGCTRWSYTRDSGRTAQMPYWRLPDSAQDHPDEATALAREALRYL